MAIRRRRPRVYAQRRVPQTYPPLYLRVKLVPLVPALAWAASLGVASSISALPDSVREQIRRQAELMGSKISERSQRLFFDRPGLDTLFVRSLAAAAGAFVGVIHGRLRVKIAVREGVKKIAPASSCGKENAELAAHILPLLPTRPYDSLMTVILTVSTAMGAMRAGAVHTHLLYDEDVSAKKTSPRPGHPAAQLRRLGAPTTLGDMCADIDELYWAMSEGHTVKITRVGDGEARRWLVSLPGTAHSDFSSTQNPADMESNVREMLGLESRMRLGLVKALHDAMRREGIDPRHFAEEPVLLVGHSQGGIVGVALASKHPRDVGVDIEGILALGAPARRVRIRPDVTMVAVAHDQDVIPSTDGTPDRVPDHRISVGRSLVRPKTSPLYYAHSSATYTETVRHLERKVRVAPWGRLASAVAALQDFLPQTGESTRVMFYEIWQEILQPQRRAPKDAFVELERAENFTPVDYYESASHYLRPATRSGRSERFRRLVVAAIGEDATRFGVDVRVQVREGFGKPTLASIDLLMPDGARPLASEVATLLERATRAVWNNRELAPIAVRARALGAPTPRTQSAADGRRSQRLVLADMTAIGFEDETARPADLYAHFGSPAFDPKWRP